MKYKKLFHLEYYNAIQFVTFRTQESLQYYLNQHNQNTHLSIAKQQLNLDQFLDTSNEGAYLNGDIIILLMDLLISNDGDVYNLIAVSIMPNHVHILFEQLNPLPITMQHIKGGSAFLINRYLGRSGILWDKSYYDKIISTEKQFRLTYKYIKNNASKAHLKDANIRFYGIYES